jgi:SAM-dependent methyltransferase
LFESPTGRPYFEIVNTELIDIVRRLPREQLVLDVGCGSGMHGDALARAYGHRVVGVDCSESSIAKARARLWRADIGDVTRPGEYPFARELKFDLIVFSDILEHLYSPDRILAEHLSLLQPGGHVVVSIPNIAIWHARLRLLTGRFEYEDTGTFDRTHIRFFTRGTVRRLVRESGLQALCIRTTPGIVRPFVPLVKRLYVCRGNQAGAGDSASILASRPYQAYMKFVYPLEAGICSLWPTLLAFQFVTLARRN